MASLRAAQIWSILFAEISVISSLEQAIAQNLPPLVSNVQVSPDTLACVVAITYDLFDAERDTMRVSCTVSNDSGRTFLVSLDSIQGDVGYPVVSGLRKQIRWHYLRESFGAAQAASSWQARIVADDLCPVNIGHLPAEVDSVRLRTDLAFLQGVRHRVGGPVHLAAVKDTIAERFVRAGLQAARQRFSYGGYPAENIVGRRPGLIDERTTYIIDGHFDTVIGSPGADDNASGVAGMLEAARLLSAYNFRNTLKFIGFDLEEVGLLGSGWYISAGLPQYEEIAGVLNFDMIGFFSSDSGSSLIPPVLHSLFPSFYDSVRAGKSRGDFLMSIGNEISNPTRRALDSCARLYVPDLRVLSLAVAGNGEMVPDLRRSDHARFWDAGYRALMLTDGANFRNRNYHQASDTLETLNLKFMTNIVKATVATTASLAGIQHAGFGVSQFFNLPAPPSPPAPTELPGRFALEQNYPNPFNASTVVGYQTPAVSDIRLVIYDLLGREAAVLVNERKAPGRYAVKFDAGGLASGVYVYRLQAYPTQGGEARNFVASKKLLLLK